MRALIASVVALVGALVLSDLTWEERRLERELEEDVGSVDRFVDFGIVLRTVRMDEDLARAMEREDHAEVAIIRASRPCGEVLIEGLPPMFVVAEQTFGGIVDTKADPPCRIGPTKNPVVWLCSEDQQPLITHRAKPGEPSRILAYGSEGAGKTTAQVMWHVISGVLRHLGQGRTGGQTGPTEARLETFREEALQLWHPSWYRYRASEDIYEFVDGSRVQLVSTHKTSKDEGSRIQSFTWAWAGSDEIQDSTRDDGGIESRGRRAKLGRYPRFCTATAKDHSVWRTWRDKAIASGKWLRATMLGLRSPFVWPQFWEDKKVTLDPRDYQRRVLAQDVGAELAVFYCWRREGDTSRPGNLVVRPQIATDVTTAVLARYRPYTREGRFSLLVGHDPGNIYNTSEILRLLMFPWATPRGLELLPTWVVVGELQTKQTTARDHARQLKEYVQRDFGIELGPDSSKALVFIDPHGKGETKTDYDTVYRAMIAEGLDAFSPATPSRVGGPGVVKRSARVGMTNRCLYSQAGGVRLVVACDEMRQPVAPVLVDGFESLEKRPGDDDPEGSQDKDEGDKTHGPAAVGLALWPFEQEALTLETIKAARAEARRLGLDVGAA